MTCREKYKYITEKLIELRLSISTMESCTAGLIASLITDTEGSSAIMKGAFVTYSNEAKIKCGIPEEVIDKYGVYSKETAVEMAKACMKAYEAGIGIGVTGSFANVDSANSDSIPGEVYFAIKTSAGIGSFKVEGIIESERYKAKLIVAEKIADELIKILDKAEV